MNLIVKAKKLFQIIVAVRPTWIRALFFGVAAGVEHSVVLRDLGCRTVLDIGANRGQFALVARDCFPDANILSFEPLAKPAEVFRRVFSNDNAITLYNVAVGPRSEKCTMHVSGRDDSSSLLPISDLQEDIFPGTGEVETTAVQVAPLESLLGAGEIVGPAILKLDVQGFELEALRGCASLLENFEWIYCECSFVELYSGQELAADVIDWLTNYGFRIRGIYNTSYDRCGKPVQADFLFSRTS